MELKATLVVSADSGLLKIFNYSREILSDKNATEKPEPEEETGEESRPDENRPNENGPEDSKDDNRPNQPEKTRPDENRPVGNRPNENRPDENRPNEDRPDDGPVEERPSEHQAIRIADFNPRPNIHSRREYSELSSAPCSSLNIDSSVCLRNNKCLVIAGDHSFWMNGRLRLMRRKKERTDEMFKGLRGKIDSAYRDGPFIHIIQGRNVTTYDAFYSEPIKRATLGEHFPGLPSYVREIHSVFKKLSTGVVYIYSGKLWF